MVVKLSEKIEKEVSDTAKDFGYSTEREFVEDALKRRILELKKSEFMSVKKVLKRLWNAIIADQTLNDSQIDHLQRDFIFAQELMSKSINKLVQKGTKADPTSNYPGPINLDAKLNCKISPIGHINNLVYRLLVSYAGHDKYLKSLPISLYIEYDRMETS